MSSTNRSNTENETPSDSSRQDLIHSTGYSSDDAIISRALKILEYRAKYSDNLSVSSPDAARDFCRLKLGGLPHEVFGVLWLDAQNRLIAFEEMFRGTLTQTSVYPREVVKTALARNAAAVILTHNHPSGIAEPSMADQTLTQALKSALALVDVKVLDHLVVSASGVSSFAERGLI
jgi:DNA repair protein RadC